MMKRGLEMDADQLDDPAHPSGKAQVVAWQRRVGALPRRLLPTHRIPNSQLGLCPLHLVLALIHIPASSSRHVTRDACLAGTWQTQVAKSK